MVQLSNDRSGSGRVARRAESRRTEILRAAARVFRRSGFAAAGMREIAAEADLSPGNLYHYFQGKDEILFFCQEQALERLLAVLDESRSAGGRTDDQLRRVIRDHVICVLDEFEGSVAHLEVEALPEELRHSITDRRDRYERGLREMISAGVRQGHFAPCDTELVTRAILGALNWTARWYRPDGSRSAIEIGEGIADYLVRGLDDTPGGIR
jgi:TetR/AcrR family transcriptional regulator